MLAGADTGSRMTTRQRRNSLLLRYLLLPAVAAAFLGYFGFWMFNGYYGVWAKARLDLEASELRAQLADLKTQRQDLQRRIALLRPDNLNPDMVDERARESLNVMRPDELVVFIDGR
jgi:cell division protein FtsB